MTSAAGSERGGGTRAGALIVGVTGGIGSGKSTLARLLAERGARLVDADRIGHRVLEQQDVAQALQRAFGADVVRPDGSVDRTVVGQRAFASASAWEALNRIVRAPLAMALWEEMARAGRQGGIVVVDAPLIYEWGEQGRFDVVVVVDADEGTRIARVQQRSGLCAAAIRQRMAWQLPAGAQRGRADMVVENSGSAEALAREASRVWRALEARCSAREGVR